ARCRRPEVEPEPPRLFDDGVEEAEGAGNALRVDGDIEGAPREGADLSVAVVRVGALKGRSRRSDERVEVSEPGGDGDGRDRAQARWEGAAAVRLPLPV